MNGASRPRKRIITLLKIFYAQTDELHTLSVPELIEKLAACGIEAERRTVYGDIELLNEMGFDIVRTRSKKCGYFLAGREFELPELKLLADAVQSAKFITYKKTNELIGKLSKLTGIYEARQLNRQVFVSDKVKSPNEQIYLNVDMIHEAMNGDCKLSFVYSEYDIDKKLHPKYGGMIYKVSPYLLTWHEDNYYMVAWHERYNRLAHFRVDKMSAAAVLNEPREKLAAAFDPAEYALTVFSMFGGSLRRVEICFDISLIGVVIDRFGKEIFIKKDDEGHFRVSVNVQVSNSFFSWILQFGAKAQIISPADVVAEMKRLIDEAASLYR